MDASPFKKLPAETRNKIYELVIGTRPSKKATNIGKACQVSIARVCKQMRAETLPMCFSNITARINVVSNFALPFNHKHETAGLDHHWGPCRASFLKGASNIMAVAQRIGMHPQACYDGVARLNLRIILDAEDYEFGLAWQVWEPHLRELARALDQRDLDGGRLCVRVEYHTFSVEEKKVIPQHLRMAFEGLGLRLDEVRCLLDRDLKLEMDNLRKEWRDLLARQAAAKEVAAKETARERRLRLEAQQWWRPWSFYLDLERVEFDDPIKAIVFSRAPFVHSAALARGEDVGNLDDEQPGYIGPGWTFCGGGGNLVPPLWLPSDSVHPLLQQYREEMLAGLEKE
ncbi:hypothetical protein M409DRAFT_49173 [Zasmidium cellare ATCC 36951]|uniref:Uncharacterized protein n=1 Tax=Zasmidium cellare ATCC 36951 TaxID=1080233 RepID=A0A6A6D2H2_ZASCE|nr:uncharacterized protein M409DRAFT_49173 [Zasmidium cellare ATCC 36951]KAF2172618.1 hypothetical protein M409DRAFT_49173 [Zasmidium cellare ATCC 36951]